MPAMDLGALLEPGLKSEAAQVYWPTYEGTRALIGEVTYFEGTSDKFKEILGFIESPLYQTFWPGSSPIPSGNAKSQRFEIVNRDFGRRVYLPRNQEDDQTGTAMQFARGIARTYGQLPAEIFYQVLQETAFNGTTCPLPVLPKWADGGDMFESSTRYGSSSGNIVSVTSTSTVQGVMTDLLSVQRRFQEFTNTQSRPFFDPAETKRMNVFHGPALTNVMQQVEFQTRLPWEVTSGSNSTGQTPTNLLQESKADIKFVNASTYIADSKYYCLLRGLENSKRPMYRQVRKGYTEWQGNFVTSDVARDTGEVYVQADCREGYGGALAIGAIKVA